MLDILRERDVEFDVIEYLKKPLDRDTLERIMAATGNPPGDFIRQDKNFTALGLDADDYQSTDAVIDLLLEHPKLMQRPIFTVGNRAVIARPIERVLELL